MDGLGDRSRAVAMVMEWQAEDEPSEIVRVLLASAPERRIVGDEASLDELATVVRTRISLVVETGAPVDEPEEMIGEPSF